MFSFSMSCFITSGCGDENLAILKFLILIPRLYSYFNFELFKQFNLNKFEMNQYS